MFDNKGNVVNVEHRQCLMGAATSHTRNSWERRCSLNIFTTSPAITMMRLVSKVQYFIRSFGMNSKDSRVNRIL